MTVKGQTLVKPGNQTLSGAGAAAYATYQAAGEKPQARLDRFGQVLGALIKAMPQDAAAAASDITKMGAVADPPCRTPRWAPSSPPPPPRPTRAATARRRFR
ncbi:hypothetical protein ACFQZC_26400 [Streptacidiphilus monticola]